MNSKREKGSSIVRVLEILEAIAKADRPMSPTDLAYELDIPKATAHRLVQTLEAEGYVQTNLRGNLMVADRLNRLSMGALQNNHFKTERRILLENLAATTGETCGISLPDGTEMIYYDRVQANWPLQVYLPIGSRVPMYCTSGGKLYLSQMPSAQLKRMIPKVELVQRARQTITDHNQLLEELELTRKRGIALDNEEFIDGMVACSVPIKLNGRMLASLFCHAPVIRQSIEDMEAMAPKLLETAAEIENLLVAAQ